MKKLIVMIAVFSMVGMVVSCNLLKKPLPEPDTDPEGAERLGTQITADIRATSTAFGIFETESNGNLKFVETDTVPLTPGQRYGWIIHLETERDAVKVREVFKMPGKPEEWINVEDGAVSDDQTTLDITETRKVVDGKISGRWKVVNGDPTGEHEIQIYIEDVLVATFNFKVE